MQEDVFDLTDRPSGRILRYLASIGAIEEVGEDKFSANSVTRNLAHAYAEAGITHK